MKTRFYILLSMALLLLTQTSCVYDKDIPCGSEDPDLLVINLNLTVPSSSTGTRSEGEDHVLVPGSNDENYINITEGDYQVLMFDKTGALVEGKLSDFECKRNSINGGTTSYTLTTTLSLSGDEDKERLSTFKVMVLANWKSFERSNTQQAFEYPSFTGYSVSGATNNIYKDGEHFNFTLKTPGDDSSWVPSINENRAIPMFGITDDVDLQFAINMAKYGDEPSFNVSMLRSLAKIELVNNTPDEDDITFTSGKLTAYNSKGRFIPDILEDKNTGWNNSETQVGAVSLPNDYDSKQLDGEEWPLVTLDGGKTFVAYIPEMDLDKIREQGSAIPQLELMVTANENEYGPYPIELGEYDGVFTEVYYPALLRNHNYTFNINSVTVGVTGELTLLIETADWDDDDDTYYYDDLEVKFAETSEDGSSDGKFKWEWKKTNIYIEDQAFNDLSWNYNGDWHKDNIEEWPSDILAQWVGKSLAVQQSDDSGAVATFTITAPERGSWTLALYSDDGTPKHWFYIHRWDPERGEWVNEDQRADPENDHNEVYDTLTGTIAGKGGESSEVKIRITASQLQDTEKVYSARLVMNVTTFDGRMAEVNLLTGAIMDSTKTSDNDYYHIIQIPTSKI